ncbi:coenzyme A pyrophosphatase [Novosphingobium marinum]|uniref:8-oxo-dGTP pyrophosphatase MutT (NUDIX family) n=1 Tax=Novosphingobium marinum TaxID=1514948 RepID=A0A7Y9XWJ7_9SPHN|nr:CoA pyrophosphatase [Novosphingobium marinum]NYH94411.1 8-oxo-dGTP pyrophosphatase MutT (NUDIX family) [Novosphingobium marinum]GGC22148.1 coenzyme A pyrophosphatase [Novosphingobium marinum]
MSALFQRVAHLFEEGHRREVSDLVTDPRRREGEPVRDAAVLIAITEREEPGFLLLHRPSNMRSHPGQVAFPGGKIDPGEDALQAALREANEELGIEARDVSIVGISDELLTGSGYRVTPVIGTIRPDIEIRPNPAEVAQWFEAPVDFALDPANHKECRGRFGGREYTYLEMYWENHRIWGVTAAIISNLAKRLRWHG